MKSLIVVGLQWGDEGKGKIIDAISGRFDAVVRWNGGNNAGHTVEVSGRRYPLSLVPSGVLQRKKLYIAQGVVINPKVLIAEIAMLAAAGFNVDLTIDPRCHIVMPYHEAFDAANEAWKGKSATGSLHLGIGYCYEDRNNRVGIRLEDLIRPEVLAKKVRSILPLKLAILRKVYGTKISLSSDTIISEYTAYGKKLARYVGDVSKVVSRDIKNKRILFEQAHGTMLDGVFGTYPYTVAPPTISSAVFPSVGIPAYHVPVLGVVKAYTTRVGNGPFPTELSDIKGETLRENGREFGTVSKRPRRCGWLDLPLLAYSVRLNGVTKLAVTKLDVLSGFSEIQVCIGYRLGRRQLSEFPDQINNLPECRPVYETLPGWKESLRGCHTFSKLPKAAQHYIRFMVEKLGVVVQYVSVGPDRKELIRI